MLFHRSFITHVALASATVALIIGLPGVASAGDATKEAATAAQHAGMASTSTDIAMVHHHLHHVVNCLVGAKGDGFDAKEANPCQGQGDGAMADASDAGQKAKISAAVSKAEAGIKSDDLAAAQKAAADAQTALK